MKIGSTTDTDCTPTAAESTAWIDLIGGLKVKGFLETTVAPSVREGMHHLIRLSGIGAMKPNTIVFGFYDSHPQTDLLNRYVLVVLDPITSSCDECFLLSAQV